MTSNSEIKKLRKICTDLGRITGFSPEFFMNLTLDELIETAEEIAEEVENSGRRKGKDL